jgi:flagellar hook-associated protein 2
MAVDYLSAINQNGSGLNTSQIVDSIVEAETALQKALINQKIENKNLEISTMAEVALELSNLKTSVSSFANNTKLSTSSASTTATLSIQDPSVAKAFNSDVQVTQLATSQTLEFPGFSSLSSTTGTGAITIDFGAWVTNGTATDTDSLFSGSNISANTSLGTPISHSVLGGTISILTDVGGDQSSTVFTVVGTDIAGNSITENITGGASGVSVSGTSVFKTVTSITPGSTVGSGKIDIGHTASTFGINSAKSSSSLTVSSGHNNTLSSIATSLNSITGVSANAINKGDGTYSLVVRSEQGYANALRLTVSETSGDEGLSALSNVSDNATHQTSAALNSRLLVDGVTIERASNTITDLFDGYSLDVTAVTSSSFRLSSSLDKVSSLDTMNSFLDAVNSTRTKLNDWTRIGSETQEAGPLARNIAVKSLKKGINDLLTGSIKGFGSDALYLSELGVRTNQDGTLSLNETTFNAQLDTNSKVFDSIFNTMFSSSSTFLKVEKSSATSNPTPGTYSYISDGSSATLNAFSMTAKTDSSGNSYFLSNSNAVDTRGIKITESQTVSNAFVFYGKSLVDTMSEYLENTLKTSGDLSKAQSSAGNSIADFNIDLSDIDDRAADLTERYKSQFSAMESAVTSLKSTGDYLTNMMKSWNKD